MARVIYPDPLGRLGYGVNEDASLLIPSPGAKSPSVGHWRVSRATKVLDGEGKRVFNANGRAIRVPERGAAHQVQREKVPFGPTRRMDNFDNPLALGTKVFDSVNESAPIHSPARARHRKLHESLAAAVLAGAVQLSDLDARTRRNVKRYL